jgi:hypothetical protein
MNNSLLGTFNEACLYKEKATQQLTSSVASQKQYVHVSYVLHITCTTHFNLSFL